MSEAQNAVPPGPARVVVADDQMVFRQAVVDLLDDDGRLSVVGQAATGVEAVALCDELAPDVLLLDLGMPEGGGLGAATELRTRERPPAIVILSAVDDAATRRQLLELGARDYLVKGGPNGDVVAAVVRAAGLAD